MKRLDDDVIATQAIPRAIRVACHPDDAPNRWHNPSERVDVTRCEQLQGDERDKRCPHAPTVGATPSSVVHQRASIPSDTSSTSANNSAKSSCGSMMTMRIMGRSYPEQRGAARTEGEVSGKAQAVEERCRSRH